MINHKLKKKIGNNEQKKLFETLVSDSESNEIHPKMPF
jgi:hypothetical protein